MTIGKNTNQTTSALSPRPSHSAAQSRRSELEHLARMSIEDRIHAALTMSRRFSWLKPAPKDDETNGRL
jgi:hypothetical protein